MNFVDQNGVSCFIDQNSVTTFIDQNGVTHPLTCGGGGSTTSSFQPLAYHGRR